MQPVALGTHFLQMIQKFSMFQELRVDEIFRVGQGKMAIEKDTSFALSLPYTALHTCSLNYRPSVGVAETFMQFCHSAI